MKVNYAKLNAGLDTALGLLSSPAGAAINPAVPAGAIAAEKLLQLIRAGVRSYETATGAPIDLAKIRHIEPLPSEPRNPELAGTPDEHS